MKILRSLMLCTAIGHVPNIAAAESLTVLTLSGAIHGTDPVKSGDGLFKSHDIVFEKAARFSLDELQELPQHEYTTIQDEADQPIRFSGPYLQDVLAAVEAYGDNYALTALDGYSAQLTSDDIARYRPIVALRADGQNLDLGGYGPARIIFPDTDDAELADQQDALEIWGLYHIEADE